MAETKQKQLVRVDFYKESGKWYSGGYVEKEILYTSEKGYFKEIVDKQEVMGTNWWIHGTFTVVTSATFDNDYVGFHEHIWHPGAINMIMKGIDI